MIGIIYKYTSPSNKVYIGLTVRERDRKAEFRRLEQMYGGDKINNARAKYKPENFKYEVLESYTFETIEEAKKVLDEREIYYIAFYDSYKNGYNSTIGGESSLGHYVTDETKLKLSIINTGKTLSEETKLKISQSNLGKHKESPSDEARKKMSESHKGLATWNTGKHYTEDLMVKYMQGRKKLLKPIKSISNDGMINHYESTTLAASILGCTTTAINAVLKGKNKTCKGLKWEYDN